MVTPCAAFYMCGVSNLACEVAASDAVVFLPCPFFADSSRPWCYTVWENCPWVVRQTAAHESFTYEGSDNRILTLSSTHLGVILGHFQKKSEGIFFGKDENSAPKEVSNIVDVCPFIFCSGSFKKISDQTDIFQTEIPVSKRVSNIVDVCTFIFWKKNVFQFFGWNWNLLVFIGQHRFYS